MISATDQNSNRRLNPFAFPAETDALFRLLMVAALMIAVNQVAVIRAIYSVSVEPSAVVASHVNLSPSKSTEQNQSSQTIDFVISLVLIAGIFGAAFFHYRAHPRRLIKKIT